MRYWAVCLAFAVASLAFAGDTVTFQYRLTKGQVIRNHMEMKMAMSMGSSHTTMDTVMTVDEVNPDGSAVVTTKIEKGHINAMGMSMNMPGTGKETKMTISKNGQVIDAGTGKSMVHVQEFPDHPVAIGESWDGTVQMSGGRDQFAVAAHFTLESVQTVDGHKIAHVAVVEKGGTTGKGAMHIDATGWMEWDVDAGLPGKSHIEGTEDVHGMSSTFVADTTPVAANP